MSRNERKMGDRITIRHSSPSKRIYSLARRIHVNGARSLVSVCIHNSDGSHPCIQSRTTATAHELHAGRSCGSRTNCACRYWNNRSSRRNYKVWRCRRCPRCGTNHCRSSCNCRCYRYGANHPTQPCFTGNYSHHLQRRSRDKASCQPTPAPTALLVLP